MLDFVDPQTRQQKLKNHAHWYICIKIINVFHQKLFSVLLDMHEMYNEYRKAFFNWINKKKIEIECIILKNM